MNESPRNPGDSMEDKRNRLQQKYWVDRIDERDWPGRDRFDSEYFILDYVHDPFANLALEAYAIACCDTLPSLSDAILAVIDQIGQALLMLTRFSNTSLATSPVRRPGTIRVPAANHLRVK